MRLLHGIRRAGALAALALAPFVPSGEERTPAPVAVPVVLLESSTAPACPSGRCAAPHPEVSPMSLPARSREIVAAFEAQSKAALSRATFALG